jgi:hypothetical protein
MTSSTRLRWIWIACFAILMNALAPAISHAVNGKPRSWEICLNDGTRVTGAGELDAATFLAVALPLPLDGALLQPTLFHQSPRVLAVWSASSPRGPPAHA